MNLKKMSRETQYIWKNMPLYMFIIMVLCVTESYCGNKYSSIFTHLIKHLINVFFFNSKLKHLIKINMLI